MYANGLTASSPVLVNTAALVATEGLLPHDQKRLRVTRLPVALLGVAFDNLTLRETVDRIEEMIASRLPHYVATANVDFLALARRDEQLQRILLNAPLVLCDGTPLVWASRLFGNTLPERVAGADVMPELIRLAARKNYRLFFLGATEEVNACAIAKLRLEFPSIEISHFSPPFRPLSEKDNAEIVRRIRASKPDMLFVAFGCPKAEKWIAKHYHELSVPVAMGVGATIDFLAGRVKRAPHWMQHSGTEWLYRLSQEPRRLFKRYANDLWFFGTAMVRQWWTMRLMGDSQTSSQTTIIQSNGSWQRVNAASSLNKDSIQRSAAQWKEIAGADRHCLLELGETKSMDSTGVALLVHLKKRLSASGRQLILLSPSPVVRRALKAMWLQAFFGVATDALKARAMIAARLREAKQEYLLEQAA